MWRLIVPAIKIQYYLKQNEHIIFVLQIHIKEAGSLRNLVVLYNYKCK